ncbi:MAG: SMP-30/gluconolactonase/LRE family protein [Betaproteobacteria bacterium]|nr:SMP-30/gluconolactonase/LRE family protein [Betaproteobacteria bacterium]
MAWKFERVAGPYRGPCGGLAWDGGAMLFSAIDEERILRFDPGTGETAEYRRYTGRTNGIAFGADGSLYGCQEGGRRVIQFLPDGSATTTATRFDGRIHNHPSDLTVDSKGRIWFADPYSTTLAFGPQIFPPLDHASVLRLERDERRAWKITRVTFDTRAPRAVRLSPDEQTLYVAEGATERQGPRELRAYPVRADGSVGPYDVLHVFGADHRGAHRGSEGMCLDGEGNIVACAGSMKSGPGPLVYVFSPSGVALEAHALPADLPMKCAFGDGDLGSLYLTTGEGLLYRARAIGRRGLA